MIAPRARCSAIARAAGEPLVGTASHARGCLLISYPKRLWARNALASEGLPSSLRDAIDQLARDHDVVTRLIAHEGPWHERMDLSLYPRARRHRDVPLADVGALLTQARPDEGEPITTPLIACCTHGVRDRCCALFGMALVRALRAANGAVDVCEASHLGGDRFAPTVLVLPSGHMYGHLDTTDASALIDAARGGPVLRRCFRGSLWRDPLEQLAEVAALDALASPYPDRFPTLGVITTTEHDADHATLRCTASIDATAVALEVRCVREHRLVVGDCRSADTNRRGSVRVWRIESASILERRSVHPPG